MTEGLEPTRWKRAGSASKTPSATRVTATWWSAPASRSGRGATPSSTMSGRARPPPRPASASWAPQSRLPSSRPAWVSPSKSGPSRPTCARSRVSSRTSDTPRSGSRPTSPKAEGRCRSSSACARARAPSCARSRWRARRRTRRCPSCDSGRASRIGCASSRPTATPSLPRAATRDTCRRRCFPRSPSPRIARRSTCGFWSSPDGVPSWTTWSWRVSSAPRTSWSAASSPSKRADLSAWTSCSRASGASPASACSSG